MFNVPTAVLVTLAVLIAVHAALSMLSPDDYTWWVLALAFIPARYAGLADQIPGGGVAQVTSFVSYMTTLRSAWRYLVRGRWRAVGWRRAGQAKRGAVSVPVW